MKRILIIIFFAVSSGICFGADVPGQKVPIEWKKCSVDSDCGAIAPGCEFFWIIANKKYFDNVLKDPAIVGSEMPCNKSGNPGPKPVSICFDHACVDKSMACEQGSDCIAYAPVTCIEEYAKKYVKHPVSYWKPVNKNFLQETENAENSKQKDLESRGLWCSASSGPKPGAQCVDKSCDLIIPPS
jgi:hypothetical protein